MPGIGHPHSVTVWGRLESRWMRLRGSPASACAGHRVRALVFRATRAWRTSGGGIEGIAAAFEQYAEQLGPALAGHWTTPAGTDPA
jgi:hypothetical protein